MPSWVFYLTIILLCGFSWFVLPFICRRIQTIFLMKNCSKKRQIALTFDDGPSEEFTLKLATYLNQNEIKATFFVLGTRAEKNISIIDRLLKLNHTVGSHSYNHKNAWYCSPIANIKDILQGIEIVSSMGGDGALFRPPYGKTTLLTLFIVYFKKLRVSWWTIDPKDSLKEPLTHDDVLDEICSKDGGVILLHDWDHYPALDHEEYVMGLVNKIIILARSKGYTFVSVPEL